MGGKGSRQEGASSSDEALSKGGWGGYHMGPC